MPPVSKSVTYSLPQNRYTPNNSSEVVLVYFNDNETTIPKNGNVKKDVNLDDIKFKKPNSVNGRKMFLSFVSTIAAIVGVVGIVLAVGHLSGILLAAVVTACIILMLAGFFGIFRPK